MFRVSRLIISLPLISSWDIKMLSKLRRPITTMRAHVKRRLLLKHLFFFFSFLFLPFIRALCLTFFLSFIYSLHRYLPYIREPKKKRNYTHFFNRCIAIEERKLRTKWTIDYNWYLVLQTSTRVKVKLKSKILQEWSSILYNVIFNVLNKKNMLEAIHEKIYIASIY